MPSIDSMKLSKEIMSQLPEKIVSQLFPVEIGVSFSELNGTIEHLYPEEKAVIEEAIVKRQREFSTGRICARKALGKLGLSEFPVLMDEDRVPVWPEGFIGSITHSSSYGLCVVTKKNGNQSMGIDLEDDERLQPRIWPNSFTEDELAWLFIIQEETKAVPLKWATLMFAAKEAFYKAQFPITRTWVGFKDAKVELSFNENAFTLTLQKDIPSFWKKNTKFTGKYAFLKGSVVASVWLEF